VQNWTPNLIDLREMLPRSPVETWAPLEVAKERTSLARNLHFLGTIIITILPQRRKKVEARRLFRVVELLVWVAEC